MLSLKDGLIIRFPQGRPEPRDAGRSNTIRRELIEETRDGVSLSMLNDPKRSPSQYHFIAGPTDSDDELAWCMTPAFGGLYFALAMCDQDIMLARPILMNKKTCSCSWMTLKQAKKCMETECNYSSIIDFIAQRIANVFLAVLGDDTDLCAVIIELLMKWANFVSEESEDESEDESTNSQ